MSIVLGYDESPGAERALKVAIDLAKQFNEKLVLVYAVAPPGGLGEEFRSHMDALTELGRTATDHAVHDADAAGVTTVVELVEAKPAQGLVDVAEEHDARLIVVGTWGESPLRSAIVGSTPHKLLYISTRPVLCVPAEHKP
jgi:nucleotide-binding universal stress UspA family protein